LRCSVELPGGRACTVGCVTSATLLDRGKTRPPRPRSSGAASASVDRAIR
jgi:hypothetical protein